MITFLSYISIFYNFICPFFCFFVLSFILQLSGFFFKRFATYRCRHPCFSFCLGIFKIRILHCSWKMHILSHLYDTWTFLVQKLQIKKTREIPNLPILLLIFIPNSDSTGMCTWFGKASLSRNVMGKVFYFHRNLKYQHVQLKDNQWVLK